MSNNKLNVKKLTEEHLPKYTHATAYKVAAGEGFSIAIQKVAQPIADERDELLSIVRRLIAVAPATSGADAIAMNEEVELIQKDARSMLNKYSNQE